MIAECQILNERTFRYNTRLFQRLDDHGVAAIEYAIVAPIFFLFVFGIIEASRMAWTQLTLERAVASAARCAALRSPACLSDAQTVIFTQRSAPGQTIPSAAISVSVASCGVRVSVAHRFQSIVPLGSASAFTLKAASCTPVMNLNSL